MNKYKVAPLAVLFLSLSLVGCFRDDSKEPVVSISELSAESQLLDSYVTQRDQLFSLSAPEVTQTGPANPITYEWEIDYQVVSNDKILNYKGEKYGKLPGRLVISNGESFLVYHFTLEVLYPFGAGVYLLAKDEKGTILSYIPTQEGRTPVRDILLETNPDLYFGKEPLALHVQSSFGQDILYLSTKEPEQLFRFEANTLTLISSLPVPRDGIGVDYITDNGNETTVTMLEGGHLVSMDRGNNQYQNAEMVGYYNTDGIRAFAPRILYLPYDRMQYLNSRLLYDEGEGRFFSIPYVSGASKRFVLQDQFLGLKLLDMDLISGDIEVIAVLLNPENNACTLAWFDPGSFESYDSKFSPRTPLLKDLRDVPASVPLGATSQIEASSRSNLLYFSNGGDLYAYSVTSKGNFPTKPLFSADMGETISDLLLNEEAGILYVATNTTGGDSVGSLYCLDVEASYKQVANYEHFTGAIKQLFLRP